MQYVELDSISIYLANGMFNNMKCNIILYTNPSIFYIKSTKCKKIGWINIINRASTREAQAACQASTKSSLNFLFKIKKFLIKLFFIVYFIYFYLFEQEEQR